MNAVLMLLSTLCWLVVVAGILSRKFVRALVPAAVLGFCIGVVQVILRPEPLGGDFYVYYSGHQALAHGLDPYYVAHTMQWSHTDNPYFYPAILAWFFAPFGGSALAFLIFCALLPFATWAVLKREVPDSALLFAFVLLGFGANMLSLGTGNISTLEMFFEALIFRQFLRRDFRGASAVVGLWGFIKILPLGIAGVLAIAGAVGESEAGVTAPRKMGARVFLETLWPALAVFAGLHLLSFLCYPHYFASYGLGLAGKLPGAAWPAEEIYNHSIAPFSRAMRFLKMHGAPTGFGMSAIVYAVILCAAGGLCLRVLQNRKIGRTQVFSFLLIAFFACWPRFKDYYLPFLALPFYFLSVGLKGRTRTALALMTSVIPGIWVQAVLLKLAMWIVGFGWAWYAYGRQTRERTSSVG